MTSVATEASINCGTVIEWNYVDTGRQARLDLLDLLLYSVDDFLRVLACSRYDHTAYSLGTVLDQRPCPEGIADRHLSSEGNCSGYVFRDQFSLGCSQLTMRVQL
jgi:hypothetical protein